MSNGTGPTPRGRRFSEGGLAGRCLILMVRLGRFELPIYWLEVRRSGVYLMCPCLCINDLQAQLDA